MIEHYFSRNPKCDFKVFEITINLDISFKIYSSTGLFSKDKLDLGTSVLLKHLRLEPNWTVLDYGCGNGVIGVYMKLKEQSLKVYATDINLRAIRVTKMNVRKYGFSDFYVFDVKKMSAYENFFDTIVLNPPMAAGLKVVREMFENSKRWLKKGGIFQVVVRSQKGGKTIEKMLNEIFGNSEVVGKKSGFKVFNCVKN
ncbi:MAG: methyltransferase [Candidatus Woesearchaeota archaeon]